MEQYIEELLDGDINALQYIYETYKSPLYAYILSIVKNPTLTEDLLQETFIKCYTKIEQYNKGSYFKAWLYTIARNLAYDYIKSPKGQYEELSESETTLEIEESVINNLVVYKEMLTLDEIDREIIVLHTIAGFKHHEIARDLGMNENTVRWRYGKALRKLRNQLGGDVNG